MRNKTYNDYVTWTRDIGELKCTPCGRVTRHAAVNGNDHDEVTQSVALGLKREGWGNEGLRDRWRQGLPRNPHLYHLFWSEDWTKAVEHRTLLTAFCGDRIKPPQASVNVSDVRDLNQGKPLAAPGDTEVEDPETGLVWVQQDCVNCLRVWNEIRLHRRRQRLQKLMTVALAELVSENHWHQYDPHLGSLIELLEAVHRG